MWVKGLHTTNKIQEDAMRYRGKIISVIVLALIFVVPLSAGDKVKAKDQIGEERYEKAVANLLVGLQSDNVGLQRSAAYMLGELQSEEALIPLMDLLRSSENECTRVTAALSLCKIGDARGVYLVKQKVRFDGSDRVQKCCAWFYSVHVDNGTFAFIPKSIGSPQVSMK